MALTIDGNNLVFTGTLTITNFTNPATGVCTLILTPDGGVGTLPALLQGDPGMPAIPSLGTVTTLSPGAAATVALNVTSQGGPGQNSTFTLSFGIPQGEQGESGVIIIGSATDLSGTAIVGDIFTVTSLNGTAPLFEYTAFPFGNVFNPSTVTTATESGPATATLASVSIPEQTFNYYPLVFASATSVGTANTVINLSASITSNGNVIGSDLGLANTPTQKLKIIPSFASLVGLGTDTSFALIDAETPASISLTATQTASVQDAWSIANTTIAMTVLLLPVSF